ncbi:TRAP transporter large permease [Chloroflexota bacterium]
MSPLTVGIIGLIFLFALLASGMPIAFAMMLIGFAGFSYLTGLGSGLSILGISSTSVAASYTLSVIPLFVLMGAFVSQSGLGRDIYYAIYRLMGHLPGGLAMATVGGCAGFAAVSGSSVATAATIGTITLPEMRRYEYDDSLATGSVAAGGGLGILIPPSMTFIIYAMLTEESVGKLFLAGIFPGILLATMFMASIYIRVRLRPNLGPPGPKSNFRERLVAISRIWGLIVLFVLVIGGIYLGIFTPTEAAGVGALGSLIYALSRRQLSWRGFYSSLIETVQTTAMIMVIMIGATIFGYFLAISRLPAEMADFLAQSGMPRVVILAGIILLFVILGCFIESLSMQILTIPIVYPLIISSGFDPIWFGVIVVVAVEMALITPPVGLVVFVIKGIAKDVSMYTIFWGIVPFVIVQLVFIVILTAFPQIALFLPNLMK